MLIISGQLAVNLFAGIRVAECSFFFFFNDTATTEIYTLSLHDALPISWDEGHGMGHVIGRAEPRGLLEDNVRSEEHTSELQSQSNLVCRLLLEKKKIKKRTTSNLSVSNT